MYLKKLSKNINFDSKIVKAKIIEVKGSSPNSLDDIILISTDTIFGTIGGGNLEYLVIDEARKLIDNNIANKVMNIPLGPGIGQCCGGYVQVKLSLHNNSKDALKNEYVVNNIKPNLYIFGSGHIGQALISKLENINFNTFIIDSREDYLKMTNIKDVNYLLSKKPWEIVSKLEDNSYFIVLTHSHDYDLKILNEILKNFTPNKKNMLHLAETGFITATDLADYLVRKHLMTFRQAYQKTALIVNLAEKKKKKLKDLPISELKKIEPKLTEDIFKVFDLKYSVNSKKSYGGTSFDNIKKMIKKYKKQL